MSGAALSTLDLNARALALSWGVDLTPNVILCPASPCQRRHCGGSVLGADCMLCARAGRRNSAIDWEQELARETGLSGLAKVVLGVGV